jgi:uncharacterized protein (TIGR03435 family)
VHREKKELPIYSLVVTKAGKLKVSTATAPPPDPDGPLPPPPPGPPKFGPDGFPVLPTEMASRPGIFMMMMPGRARLTATAQTMQDFANRLSMQLNRPVVDNTGSTAKYDFVLTYAPDPNEGLGRGGPGPGGPMIALAPGPGAGAGAGPGPGQAAGGGTGAAPGPGRGANDDNLALPEGETPQPLLGALQSQLGLKLEPKKGGVDIIIIDKIEKTPTEN